MIQKILHQKIVENIDTIKEWFQQKSQNLQFPFYSSFDLRDSSVKITPVDANLFPAGFNNICLIDQQNSIKICKSYLDTHFSHVKHVILLAEEHTHNPFYWNNIYALKTLLEKSNLLSVCVCVPGKNIKQDTIFTSADGNTIEVFLLKNKIYQKDLIISNNDFSVDYHLDLSIPMIPAVELGWYHRRKHTFFEQYNLLATEFAGLINVDPFFLTIKTKRFVNFESHNPQCLKRLKEEVSLFLSELKPIYKNTLYKDQAHQPFVFVKNNSGTYGLGITTLTSPLDIDNWNYKVRKKMKGAKGGNKVYELIIQEGIFSHLKQEGSVAEPVIYLIGSVLAGGFLRTNKEKGVRDNLNSPGAVYRRLCVSDLEIEIDGKPMENVYGWIAYLGVLALAQELYFKLKVK